MSNWDALTAGQQNTLTVSQPNKVGRHSSYDPAYCDRVIEWGAQGKSRMWMAAKLGVSRQRIYDWEENFPEFRDALTRAKALEQMWWEDEGQTALRLQGYQGGMWSRSMAARFPDDWRETSRQEQTGANGGPIQQETKHVGLDEFASRIAGLATRAREESGNSEPDGGPA